MGDYESTGSAEKPATAQWGKRPAPGPVCQLLGVNWLDSGGVAGLFPPTEDQQQHKTKPFTSLFAVKSSISI